MYVRQAEESEKLHVVSYLGCACICFQLLDVLVIYACDIRLVTPLPPLSITILGEKNDAQHIKRHEQRKKKTEASGR